MRKIILAGSLAALTFAQAAAAAECNKNGAIVTLDDGTTLYLGKSCDAARKSGGTGSWWNAASFLGVKIGDKAYMVTEDIDCLPFCST